MRSQLNAILPFAALLGMFLDHVKGRLPLFGYHFLVERIATQPNDLGLELDEKTRT
jgi:hypothetical protein